jgi:hypothetical protein
MGEWHDVHTSKKENCMTTRQRTTANNAAVIRAAVDYAQGIATFHASFRTGSYTYGNYKVADQAGARAWDKVVPAMKRLTSTPAMSAEALDAKARVLEIIREDEANETPVTESFYRSFATDVRTFVKALHEEKRRLKEHGCLGLSERNRGSTGG